VIFFKTYDWRRRERLPTLRGRQMKEGDQDENRLRQFAVGGSILVVISTSFVCLLLFWRFMPGWVGESFGMVAGVVSTPFFMEFSFVVTGFFAVVLLNSYRRRLQGGDYVEIDQEQLPEEFRSDSDEDS